MIQPPSASHCGEPPPETLVALFRRRATENGSQAAFTFPLDVHDAEPLTLTYAEVDARARAVAGWLQSIAEPGKRVCICYPPSVEFVTSFAGALYAGVIAVPVYPPNLSRLKRTLSRLQVLMADAEPAVALAPAAAIDAITDDCPESIRRVRWVAIETIGDAWTDAWHPPHVDRDAVAVLQYTSGSTATPKGVMLTHRNVLTNLAMLQESCGTTSGSVFSSWLPLAHDMGLFGRLLAPVYVGGRSILTSPELFMQRPIEWLAMVARLGATCFGGPNFAYESCVRFATPESVRALDLRRWELATIGTEFVRPGTMERFASTFAPSGFRRELFFNGYGLAEATLFVCGGRNPRILRLDQRARQHNVASVDPPADAPAVTIVGSGRPPNGVRLAVVDPRTLTRCGPGEIGEIWVAGDHVGVGYWRNPGLTAETFQAYTADGDEGPYLRTGDLGFILHDELFVTGRLKDVIIIHGRNLYPIDLELTVEACHPALRPGCTAAFSITQDDEERVVVLQELRSGIDVDAGRLAADIRDRLADEHEVLAHTVVLLREGSLPKTTSGKVQRASCRDAYRDGTLDVVTASTCAQSAGAQAAEFLPPRTATERKLVRLWKRVLDADQIGIYDNFVDLGGQSVQANQAIAGVQRLFRVELQPSHFFSETATVAELARVIDGLRRQPQLESAAVRQ